ncbi:unnamed protein product [Didymodactylos carnosus]|uniref:Uncharacterized protein n=1 Tax=Didymodactylos carnosus TaxID=1234261 RepID=A0A815BAS9_9BILA|nr:unnamed protein product [Didymodactylos carnosus]CAF1273746.1 unnamed protein product [Didymodactylos carnosus]CAF4056814.1 unnamed protein product [Didymodactylos carnosus]CAF4078964.1 unnamed protein product [Didymodactylos carnosus]
MFFYTCANVVYIVGMIGYLIIDIVGIVNSKTIESTPFYIVYVLLAIMFVIDAILYTLNWYVNAIHLRKNRSDPINNKIELVACLFNLIGSIIYLLGAITTTQTNNANASTTTITTTVSTPTFSNIPSFVLNIIGMLSLTVESILTIVNWKKNFKPNNKLFLKNVEFWAHLLNLIGNLVYLIAHIVQPIVTVISSFTTSLLSQLINNIFIIIRPIQVAGDFIYLIDSILYTLVWLKVDERRINPSRIFDAWTSNRVVSALVTREKTNVKEDKKDAEEKTQSIPTISTIVDANQDEVKDIEQEITL